MSAVRLARGATGREKLVKFDGCYHGHSDAMLVGAGSGALTQGVPDSAGVTAGAARDTLLARYNDLSSVSALFDANHGQIAAVIVEPVAANMGVVPPVEGFLEGLRSLCDQNGALLLFDEVITGFRLGLGGAQEYFGVRADLVTFGKIIGGGMPVGAYAGRRELMEQVAPTGPVYQAGTLSGNPAAMAAGLAQLRILREHPEYYAQIAENAAFMADRLRKAAEKYGVPMQVNQCGALLCPYFTGKPVRSFEDAGSSDLNRFRAYFHEMLGRGIYLAPSQYEAVFVNVSHSRAEIETACAAAEESLAAISRKG